MIRRLQYILLALFLVVCLSSVLWHWAIAIRVFEKECRFETQYGEFAISFWLGRKEYPLEAPLVWYHPADPRLSLVDCCTDFSWGGFGFELQRGTYNGVLRGGIVLPWWFLLICQLLLIWFTISRARRASRSRRASETAAVKKQDSNLHHN